MYTPLLKFFVIHLYNNLALLNNGKVYDLSTDNILKNNSNSGILSNSIPLKTYVLNDSVINTYYNFTLINEELIESQMFIKDKDLSATADAAENEARDLAEEELIKAVKSLNLTIN